MPIPDWFTRDLPTDPKPAADKLAERALNGLNYQRFDTATANAIMAQTFYLQHISMVLDDILTMLMADRKG